MIDRADGDVATGRKAGSDNQQKNRESHIADLNPRNRCRYFPSLACLPEWR